MRLAFIFSALIFSVTLTVQANNNNYINFEHISIGQGLSQGTASCIIQDNHGFIWFGTQDGLNRYDGHEFKLYTYDFNKPDTLSHNLVISICKDQPGIFWIGTQGGGLNKFDPQTEKFTNHRGNKIFEPLKDMVYFKSVKLNEDIDTVVWPNNADFSPDFLYEIGQPVND